MCVCARKNWQIFSFLFWDGGLKSVQSSSSGNSHLRWMRRAPIELGAGLAAPTDAINKSKAAWVCSHDGFHNEVTMKCSLFLWIPVSTFAFFETEEEPLARQIIRRFNRKFGFAVQGEKGENWKVKRRVWSQRWEGVDIISDNGRLERRALLADEYVVSAANLHLLPNSQTEIELTNDGYPVAT